MHGTATQLIVQASRYHDFGLAHADELCTCVMSFHPAGEGGPAAAGALRQPGHFPGGGNREGHSCFLAHCSSSAYQANVRPGQALRKATRGWWHPARTNSTRHTVRPAVADALHWLLSVVRAMCARSCFSQVADLGASVDKLNKVGSLHKACTSGNLQHLMIYVSVIHMSP